MWTYKQTITNNELYHYGVPGMKWGIKKAKQEYITSSKNAINRDLDRTEKAFLSNPGGGPNRKFIKGKDNKKLYKKELNKGTELYKKDISDAKAKYKAERQKWKQKNKDFHADVNSYTYSDRTHKQLWEKLNKNKGSKYIDSVKKQSTKEFKKNAILSGASFVLSMIGAGIAIKKTQ